MRHLESVHLSPVQKQICYISKFRGILPKTTQCFYPYVKGYEKQLTCEWPHCRLDFKVICDVIVSYISFREVDFVCLESDQSFSQKTMIYYPDDLYLIDLRLNNISSIDAYSFATLNSLNRMYLGDNVIEMLNNYVFQWAQRITRIVDRGESNTVDREMGIQGIA